MIRIDILQAVIAVKHAVRRNSRPVFPKFLYAAALDHLPQQHINEGPKVILPHLHLL